MPRRYFLVPREGAGDESDPYRPKYLFERDGDGVTERAGIDAFSASRGIQPDENTDPHYAVVVWGTQSELNAVARNDDVTEYDPANVRDALNATDTAPFDLSAKEWADALQHAARPEPDGSPPPEV